MDLILRLRAQGSITSRARSPWRYRVKLSSDVTVFIPVKHYRKVIEHSA